jgi:hypothetical protein
MFLFCFGKIYRNRQVISSGDSAYRWAPSPISTVNKHHFVDMYLRYSIYATHSIYHCVIRYIPSRRNEIRTATAVVNAFMRSTINKASSISDYERTIELMRVQACLRRRGDHRLRWWVVLHRKAMISPQVKRL